MTDEIRPERTAEAEEERQDERVLDPGNLDAEHHAIETAFRHHLSAGEEDDIRELALALSPVDLSEILRPLSVDDTAMILRLLPPDEDPGVPVNPFDDP